MRLCGEFVKILPLWSTPFSKGLVFFATSSFDLLASFPRIPYGGTVPYWVGLVWRVVGGPPEDISFSLGVGTRAKAVARCHNT